jgi:hypothetical protein
MKAPTDTRSDRGSSGWRFSRCRHQRAGPKRSGPFRLAAGTDPENKLRLQIEYHLLCLVQAPFEFVFWSLEQRKGRLADKLANEGKGQP